MNIELKDALEALEVKLVGKNATEIKALVGELKDTIEGELTVKMANYILADGEEMKALKNEVAQMSELKSNLELVQKHADNLDLKLKNNETSQTKGGDAYIAGMVKALTENFEGIKSVRKGQGTKMELKVVGDMILPGNLTGDSVFTYQNGVARVPSQKINVSDLIPTIQSATGTYVIYRETGSEGSISSQGTQGASKTQIDYDFTAVTFNATYLSGYARFAKQMAQDLPFLTSFLPEALRRDYFKVENSTFYGVIETGATASTATGTTAIERIIQDMGALEATNFDVNGIVVNPIDWATIAITKPSDFSLPSVVTFINGMLTINGVQVFKASWVPQDEYVVGDWSQAKKVTVDGLAVEFFEQDADNVTKNLITARVECRCVCAVDRPDAFITGTITPST